MKCNLSSLCGYREGKVNIKTLTTDTYISTENMRPNRCGVVRATSLPTTTQTQEFKKGDVLVSNIRPYFKKVWQAKFDGGCSNDVLVFEANKNTNADFLYYVLSDDAFFAYSMSTSKGTKMPRGDKTSIMQYNVPVFDITKQKKIAGLLKNIDDVIYLNNKENENLFSQLFAIYNEKIVNVSECHNKKLGTLCEFQEGYVNPSQNNPQYFDGSVKWLRAVDINNSFIIETSRTLTDEGFLSAKKSALLFEPNTIAISKSGTIGRLGIIADYMCGNRAVINIKPKKAEHLPLIYCYLKEKQHLFLDLAVGSVQKNLYVSVLEQLDANLPSEEIISDFCNIAQNYLDTIKFNCIENNRLIQLRDTLLPKLISGELDVSEVNI